MTTVAVLVAGPPIMLWWLFGNPIDVLPSWQEVSQGSADMAGSPRGVLRPALVWLLWLLWAAVVVLLLGSLVTVVAGWRPPIWRLPAPLHRLVFGLAGTAVITLVNTPHATTPAPAAATQPASQSSAPDLPAETGLARGPAMVQVGDAKYQYVVERGDTLSKIARHWLGDADRWPEICDLNRHRHFQVGGTLRDCDLIYPGWNLTLPTDATPPTGATPAPPPPPVTDPQPDPGPTEQPTPSPSASSIPTTSDPDGVVEPAGPSVTPSATATTSAPGAVAPPSATPEPATSSQSAAAPSDTVSPGATASPPDDEAAARPSADADGVTLPGGSFVPWALAGAIVAAAAMVWLQRRRRFIPGNGGDDDPPELPPPVAELHRQVSRNPDLPTPSDLAERAAAVPVLPLLPPGGVGLVGDGAHAAARAALISSLAAGGPQDPDRRGEVVIDGTTLSTLIGADAAALGPWPRLHIADDLDHALTLLDSRLLHRARILDEHSLTDLDYLRERAPDEEALPPVLFVCETPPPGARMRAKVSFGLGNGLDVSALLLGEWPHGSTITITADGHTHIVDGEPVEAIGDRVAVLDTAEAVAILTTLREAHTGEPPNPVLRAPAAPRKPAPANAPDTELELDGDAEPSEQFLDEPPQVPGGRPRPKVHLRVLGTPTVEDVVLPGRSLRGKAAELAVYLACHPDGADTETIAEYLFPESRRRPAKQSVHTNASNLRHVLGRAGGPITAGYVLKRGANARYRLDPTTVSVDLWQLRDLLSRAQLASTSTRTDLLREACDLYTAPLADGCDYEWVDPHREKARQWGTEAHLLLADDLLTSDPRAASDLLDKAIGLDRYNEELYRKAMHARHALGDADGIRALLRAVTKALSDLDAEPADTTLELAAQLRTSLEQQ